MYWVKSLVVSLSVAEYFFKTIALTASNYVSLGWLQLQSSFPRHRFSFHLHTVFFCVFAPLAFQSWLQSPRAFFLTIFTQRQPVVADHQIGAAAVAWQSSYRGERTRQTTVSRHGSWQPARDSCRWHKQTEDFKHETSVTSHAF